jgi:hypothetical protein
MAMRTEAGRKDVAEAGMWCSQLRLLWCSQKAVDWFDLARLVGSNRFDAFLRLETAVGFCARVAGPVLLSSVLSYSSERFKGAVVQNTYRRRRDAIRLPSCPQLTHTRDADFRPPFHG